MRIYESELRTIAKKILSELFTKKNISISDLLGSSSSDDNYIGDDAVDGFDDFDDGDFGESDKKDTDTLEEVED
jgi:hypothetical protein